MTNEREELRQQELDDTENRRNFLKLEDKDAHHLRELREIFDTHAEEFVEEFYSHLFQFEETSRFLEDQELVTRLKRFQTEHLKSMLDAEWGIEYNARRRIVGQAHADIGIEPQLFLGAYNQYLQFFLKRLNIVCESKAECEEKFSVLLKATLYDVGLTLDAYFTHSTQQIRKALDLYWQANAELRQFAELTSHDLKTPLGTLANLCDEVIDEFGDQMPAEAVKMISQASVKTFDMSRMIDALLASANISHEENSSSQVHVKKIIEILIRQMQYELRKNNITVILKGEFPDALGDPARLKEAFSNLLSNAIKYIELEPGLITITGAKRGGGVIGITVADNGTGIPESELQKIFVPFRRLPTHSDDPGSGLGLYFTKQIIEANGGRVWAEALPGQGATFHVELRSFDQD
ncbi:MAG: hypothetical protein COA78_15895 [Blastopirellula sp.]|nr:MAG: hypothetical protein COA78_15895 [Blastopirellula sp.]